YVDGAFVLNSDGINGKIARISYVEKEEDIINSAKSKYIPASIYDIIKKIKSDPLRKYAVVGTSCQFQALRKFLEIFKISQENILLLGLFCDRTLNYNVLQYFRDISRSKNRILKVDFRNKERNGWPGDVKLYYENKKEFFIDRKKRMEVKDYFQLNRCVFCLDKLNIDADISFGDCYIKNKSTKDGETNIIIRTEKGKYFFEKVKDRFDVEKTNLGEIMDSQKIEERIKNFNKFNFKKIKIFIGAYYPKTKIFMKLWIFFEKNLKRLDLLTRLVIVGFSISLEIIKHFLSYLFGKFQPEKNKKLDKVIILGGGMENKGAQAMTFTVVDQIRIKNPNCEIFLFSNESFDLSEEEKNKYNFKILPWSFYDQLGIFFKKINLFEKYNINNKHKDDLRSVFYSADCIFDVSGYALSSQWGFFSSLRYILNIIIAKKYLTPFVICPQSFGPFHYHFWGRIILPPLIMLYLKYPNNIYAREMEGYNALKKYTKNNLEKSFDIVLNDASYNLKSIYNNKIEFSQINIKPNSIGIIPNQRVIENMKNSKKDLFQFYIKAISEVLKYNRNVYIIRHSVEDLKICQEIKEIFQNNEQVILIKNDLCAIELEDIIKQFDFIIASRYHSIIHAYKNKIPAVAIGWAIKYKELLEEFNQLEYFIDCREKFELDKNIKKIDIISQKYKQDKETIEIKLDKIKENYLKIL
ncbi:MAG: Coenzyme F420 hydrogenase/dehydrogenase, beta subunit C-terminal domain, partial [Candidatus Moraniibacteriota bacterium]